MLKQEQALEKERQFICSCAKSYFSYAALFTHIKQKHDGKAPGPITKPKSENKRGRPRKTPPLSHSLTLSSLSEGKSLTETQFKEANSNGQFNSNPQPNQKLFDLKSTPGSQFKQYKKDSISVPSSHESFIQLNFEWGLLQDLSRYLEIKKLNLVPEEMIEAIDASASLKSVVGGGEGEGCKTAEYFRSFLVLCKEGLKVQTYSQVLLLMAMFLQHIVQSCQLQSGQLQLNLIYEHIVSFFEYINRLAVSTDLSPFAIFNDLSTIKTLIVFFNWLSKTENRPAENPDSDSL